MSDLARLQSELIRHYPEPWVRHHLKGFQDAYFSAFDDSDVARHLGLMVRLDDEHPVAVEARPADGGGWWVDVVGYDTFQFLSTVCNLLAVRGFSIVEGRIFTSQPPPREPARSQRRVAPPARPTKPTRSIAKCGPDGRRKLVDVFHVVPEAAGAEPPDWARFQDELTAMARLLREGQYDEVHHRLIGRMVAALEGRRADDDGLEPLDLEIDPEGSEFATVVRIGARDSFGFLYLTASALALCGITIVRADVRTQAGRVDDTLWVTDRFGRKLVEESKLRELRLSLILIEHFCSRLPRATNPEAALLHFSRFVTDTMARPDWAEEFALLDRPEALDALARVLGESDFLWEDYLLVRPDALLPMISDPSEWNRRRGVEELAEDLRAALDGAGTFEAKCQAIGRFKDREIFRADIRTILRQGRGPEDFSAELSDLAEVLLGAAYRLAVAELGPDVPRCPDGRPAPSALCALGKFGGRELGFGSDLELMLVYADDGVQPPHSPSTADDFDQVVTLLRAILATRRDGAFGLDFRLRPFGRGGPLATSLTTFLNYYRVSGPAWCYERQALVKLRAVAGDPEFGREVEAHRDRYVYGPEPFDVEGFRRMRRLQVEQLAQPGTINAKFSPGALVDIEYFVQALQIAHGAADARLRTPSTMRALAALGEAGRLGPAEAETLRSNYAFFRALIDALRVVHGDPKDLTVPRSGSEEFALLARRMREASPEALRAELNSRLASTREIADRLPGLLHASPSRPDGPPAS